MKTKRGGYLTLKIRLLNGRLFNKYLSMDERALYNAEQGKIISALWDSRPLSASELANITGLANSSLTPMLKRLVEQGLLVAVPSETDKRKKMFDLTELGIAQEQVGNDISKHLSDVFYRGFSEEEISAVDGYLERILNNLETEAAKFPRKS